MQLPPAATSGHSVLEVLRELTRVLQGGLSATEPAANDDSVEEARRIELCQLRRCIRALIAEACCLELEAIGARCEQPQLLNRVEHLCAGAHADRFFCSAAHHWRCSITDCADPCA